MSAPLGTFGPLRPSRPMTQNVQKGWRESEEMPMRTQVDGLPVRMADMAAQPGRMA
jgi:hypothetical protein